MSKPDPQPEKPSDETAATTPPESRCMDCSTALSGSFCYVCGQRKQRRVASVSSLASEYVLGILDWDSRIWRTLRPLLLKPGHLTRSYMEGKRERYSPPIRLYLISSIIFFLLISLAPKNFLDSVASAINSQLGNPDSPLEMGLDSKVSRETFRAVASVVSNQMDVQIVTDMDDLPNGDGEAEPIPNDSDAAEASPFDIAIEPPAVTLDDRDVLSVDDIEAEDAANDVATQPSPAPEAESSSVSATASDTASESPDADTTDENALTLNIDDAEILVECEAIRTRSNVQIVEFLRLPMYRFCLTVSSWRGLLAFMEELVESLPTTLLILMPLMALVNKLLYLFARRYYVEHLLFYVHNYSFIFLFTVVLVVLSKLLSWVGLGLSGLIGTIGTLYVMYYFLKSMRVVYGQGRLFTFVKWCLLFWSFIGLAMVVLAFFTLATAAVYGL